MIWAMLFTKEWGWNITAFYKLQKGRKLWWLIEMQFSDNYRTMPMHFWPFSEEWLLFLWPAFTSKKKLWRSCFSYYSRKNCNYLPDTALGGLCLNLLETRCVFCDVGVMFLNVTWINLLKPTGGRDAPTV